MQNSNLDMRKGQEKMNKMKGKEVKIKKTKKRERGRVEVEWAQTIFSPSKTLGLNIFLVSIHKWSCFFPHLFIHFIYTQIMLSFIILICIED